MIGAGPRPIDAAQRKLLGIVLAGGESRRFGGEKAMFPLMGRVMARWALEAVAPWTVKQGVLTNDLRVAEALGVPSRADIRPGLGPLGGLHTGLTWAVEEGLDGVFLLACDLPLVPEELVGRILRSWPLDAFAAVPESHGPLGFEPTCGAYDVRALPAVEVVLDSGRCSMESALSKLETHRIPTEWLGTPEELATAFTNVNTRDTALRAEEILRERASAPGLGPSVDPDPSGPPRSPLPEESSMKSEAPPIVCIVGRKNAGKTELTVGLGAELNRRGYRVMTVKHGHGFQLDQPGRDSWRHRHEGGAIRTVLAGPSDFAVVGNWPQEEMPLAELVKFFLWDADIVLAEGFKRSPEPKVEVFRDARGSDPIFDPGDEMSSKTIAFVTDRAGMALPIPLFDLMDKDHLRRLADFLEERFLKGRSKG